MFRTAHRTTARGRGHSVSLLTAGLRLVGLSLAGSEHSAPVVRLSHHVVTQQAVQRYGSITAQSTEKREGGRRCVSRSVKVAW